VTLSRDIILMNLWFCLQLQSFDALGHLEITKQELQESRVSNQVVKFLTAFVC